MIATLFGYPIEEDLILLYHFVSWKVDFQF